MSSKHSPHISPIITPVASNEIDDLTLILKELYIKYENDEFVKNKLIHHIKNFLPNHLSQLNQIKIQREERKKSIEERADEFIEEFLNSTTYFYNSNIDYFFVYQNNTYKIISEDDIDYHIRTTITHKKVHELNLWKYKIKNQIIKHIKERDLLTSIPESETIQHTLNALTPLVFKNRDNAKYFLTIIGDILLKKNNNTYFVHPKSKQFLTELSQESCIIFGTTNLLNNFKFKFYEHKYEDCRLIDINDNFNNMPFYNSHDGLKLSHSSSSSSLCSLNSPTNSIKQSMIDFFCVAAHYSSRFHSADEFIEKHCKDISVIQHAFYLKNNSENDIIMKFIHSTTDSCIGYHISWKNMLYLWKIFIEEQNIPNVFFNNSLKNYLIKNIDYNEENDFFINRTSKYLPLVSKFITFWNENIIIHKNEFELEIDELSTLFINYNNQKNNIIINDSMILGLVKHFFGDIIIEDNKYLINVGCKLWDKQKDISNCLQEFKKKCIEEHYTTSIPLYNIYQFYCKFENSQNKYNVSKRYFEKYFIQNYCDYLDENNYVIALWWNN